MDRSARAAAIALVVLACGAAGAAAARLPTQREVERIDRAVSKYDDRYCATRAQTRISTSASQWAVAWGYNNCNSGSTQANFFLRRSDGMWRVRYAKFGGPGGVLADCGPKAVPRDIRCGARSKASHAQENGDLMNRRIGGSRRDVYRSKRASTSSARQVAREALFREIVTHSPGAQPSTTARSCHRNEGGRYRCSVRGTQGENTLYRGKATIRIGRCRHDYVLRVSKDSCPACKSERYTWRGSIYVEDIGRCG